MAGRPSSRAETFREGAERIRKEPESAAGILSRESCSVVFADMLVYVGGQILAGTGEADHLRKVMGSWFLGGIEITIFAVLEFEDDPVVYDFVVQDPGVRVADFVRHLHRVQIATARWWVRFASVTQIQTAF